MGYTPLKATKALMSKYEGRMHEAVTMAVQTVALTAGDYFARETPVDTGVARSNWVATLNDPFPGIIPAYFPYPSYRINHHESVKQLNVHSGGVSSRRSVGKFIGVK